MRRYFGTIAIFCGWLSLPVGATAGLIDSQLIVISFEGGPAPLDVYGISGMVVFWVFVGATALTAVPLAMAMRAADPPGYLRMLAAAMAIVGMAFIGSELGRAYGLPIVAGAAGLWIGGDLLHQDALAAASMGGSALSPGTASEPGTTANLGADAGLGTGPSAFAEAAPLVAPASLAVPSSPAGADGAPAAGEPPAIEVSDSPRPESSAALPSPRPADGPRRRAGGKAAGVADRICPWCSTPVPAEKAACPSCGATLDAAGADGISIPGLTEVPPSLRKYAEDARSGKKPRSLLKLIFSDTSISPAIDAPPPSNAEALRPPSAAVRAEMARLGSDIAAGLAPVPIDDEAAEPTDAPEPAGGEPTDAPEPAGGEPRA